MKLYLIIIVIMSILTALVYLVDKIKAINYGYRIKERTLLLFSFLFGSLGGLFSLYVIRHKNRHLKFVIFNWLFFFVHLLIGYLIYINYWQNKRIYVELYSFKGI